MSDLLNIGKSGLFASRKALETTGHNIANANTKGYSRQRVIQTTNIPILKQGGIQGTGTRVKGTERIQDEFVEKRLSANISDHKYFEQRSQLLDQVEEIFNEVNNEGLNHVIEKFYNSFRELSNQPENETIRSVVRDNASLVVKDLKRIRSSVDSMARNVDNKLNVSIADINQNLHQIARLNKKITEFEAGGGEIADLRDQRDLAIRTLSEYFKIHTYYDDKGLLNVSARGVGTLVSGGEVQELMAGTRNKSDSSNNMAGSVEIYFASRPHHKITDKFQGGLLNAAVKTRNDDIRNLQEQVDTIAYELANTVNAVHRRGFVNRKISIDAQGNPSLKDYKGPTTGLDFFNIPLDKEDAASLIDLSSSVKNDLSNIVTALNHNSPGDNRISLAISKLQHEKTLGDGTTTLEEHYLKTIGAVGLESGKAKLDSEQAEGILAQTNNIRERISGVSIDEETANMVRYQHAFDAAARVMRTADDMFKTVLALKR